MKVRSGFVSNSSSSSFIVTFPGVPKDVQECHDMMFPNGPESVNYHTYRGDFLYTSMDVAKAVFRDIELQMGKSLSNEELQEKIKETAREIAEMGRYSYGDYDLTEDEFLNMSPMEIARMHIAKIHENMQKGIFHFHYGDESGGLEAFMEHGEIFENLPHTYESHH